MFFIEIYEKTKLGQSSMRLEDFFDLMIRVEIKFVR